MLWEGEVHIIVVVWVVLAVLLFSFFFSVIWNLCVCVCGGEGRGNLPSCNPWAA